MDHDFVYLFTGYGSELTLDPLYDALRERGYPAVRVDFLTDSKAKETIYKLRGKKVVYITSSHLLFDEEIRCWYAWKKVQCLSPVEIFSLLNPIFSVYYPHDLHDQIQDAEEAYLALFDLILAPDTTMKHYPFIDHFEDVGYIKLLKETETTLSTPLFLPSNVMKHLGSGIDNFVRLYKPVLEKSIVKFPPWDYTAEFEAMFEKKGIQYYPSEKNSVELMQQHDVIIGEACSSTIYEGSKLGKKVIYLENPELDHKDIKTIYQGLKEITFTTVEKFPSLDFAKLPNGKKTLKPFNMDLALTSIIRGAKQAYHQSQNKESI